MGAGQESLFYRRTIDFSIVCCYVNVLLVIKCKKEIMFQYIKSFFVPRLSPEAFEAYFNKLPDAISVNWFRDGRYIIGRIRAEDKQFMTQGRNPDEFINMVNDAVVAAYEIPENYANIVKKTHTFKPKVSEMKRLYNHEINKDSFGSTKSRDVLRLA